jgi:Ala-tRNA(Pro) deacylase
VAFGFFWATGKYSYAKSILSWQPLQAKAVTEEHSWDSQKTFTVVGAVSKYHFHRMSTTMPAKPDDLFTFLDRLQVSYRSVTHPPLFTVEQSQSLRGQIPGSHTKNLFLKDKKGALYLVVALEDAAIDLKSLQKLLGTGRLSFGSADLLRQTLGVEPGSVTPFAAVNDEEHRVTIILDAAMMEHETLNYHPLVNTMTTAIASGDLLKFLEATGHRPRIAPVSSD